MTRSEINREISWAIALAKKVNLALPAFALWQLEDWRNMNGLGNIPLVQQGWDVTDYGRGNFAKVGAVLFTLRNGNVFDASVGTPYCEKMIAMRAGQMLPLHFHYSKTEDIINRGGGTLLLKLFNSKPNTYELDYEKPVQVFMDGILREFRPGEIVKVAQGNSITLTPYTYHAFWAKEGDGDLVIGEVSTINDDSKDNHFAEQVKAAPIVEDEPILYPLCGEYGEIRGRKF